MELPISGIIEIATRPVTFSEVMKAARMGSWKDRRMLFLYPWPIRVYNIQMWLLIGCISIVSAILIGMSLNYPGQDKIPFILATTILATFSMSVMYIQQITSGLGERLVERQRELQNAIREQMQQSVDAYGEEFADHLEEVTGREHIKPDPISMAAAVIEMTKKNRRPVPPVTNPLRALLDGTLNPRDIMQQDDPNSDHDFLE